MAAQKDMFDTILSRVAPQTPMTPYGPLDPPLPALLWINGVAYDVEIVRRRRTNVEVRNMSTETLKVPGPSLLSHHVAPGATVTVPASRVEVLHGR